MSVDHYVYEEDIKELTNDRSSDGGRSQPSGCAILSESRYRKIHVPEPVFNMPML
jgi:hypothetical protein